MDRQVAFPIEEYQRRWRNVQQVMHRNGLDALLVTNPESVFYLTGYQTFGDAQQFLVVGSEGPPVPVLRDLEFPLVLYTTWLDDGRRYQDHEDPVGVVVEELGAILAQGGPVGVESHNRHLPADRLAALRAAAPFELRPAGPVVEEVRAVKSAAELALARKATAITGTGMRAALEVVKDGTTENDVAAAAAAAMYQAGSEWFGEQPIVTSGPRSAIPHTTFARRRLEPGDAVLIELSAAYHRHFSPLMRSAVVGPPSRELAGMHDACVQALEAALRTVRPGVTSGEAHAACQDVIDAHGFTDNFRKRLGYAVGVGFTSWSEGHVIDLKAGDERVLAENMLFHMPPALRDPRYGGVGLSETIVVTRDGCEVLGDVPRDLHIA